MKKIVTIASVAALVLSLVAGTEAEAAKKPALSKKKMSITVGKSKILKLKDTKKSAKWSVVSGKKRVALKNKKKASVKIVAKTAGKAKVQAKVGKKKLVCQITVKAKAAPTSTPTPAPTPANKPQVTAKPVTKVSQDEQSLKTFIASQKAKGATVSEDIYNTPEEYTWDLSGEEGKLINITWKEKNLQGDISFSAFKNLESLEIWSSCEVTSVDVTGNTNLKKLEITDTAITALDVSKNVELQDLSCNFNYLWSLDVTNNAKLRILDCSSNLIDELDVSKNKELESLDCYSNGLQELDLTNNVKIWDLSCGSNGFETLDVSMLPELVYLTLEGSKNITTLDISKNHKLVSITCTACHNLATLILNPEIVKIDIEDTAITEIDASNCLATPFVYGKEEDEYTLIPPQ